MRNVFKMYLYLCTCKICYLHFVYYSIEKDFAFEKFGDLISQPLLHVVLKNIVFVVVFMFWSTRFH